MWTTPLDTLGGRFRFVAARACVALGEHRFQGKQLGTRDVDAVGGRQADGSAFEEPAEPLARGRDVVPFGFGEGVEGENSILCQLLRRGQPERLLCPRFEYCDRGPLGQRLGFEVAPHLGEVGAAVAVQLHGDDPADALLVSPESSAPVFKLRVERPPKLPQALGDLAANVLQSGGVPKSIADGCDDALTREGLLDREPVLTRAALPVGAAPVVRGRCSLHDVHRRTAATAAEQTREQVARASVRNDSFRGGAAIARCMLGQLRLHDVPHAPVDDSEVRSKLAQHLSLTAQSRLPLSSARMLSKFPHAERPLADVLRVPKLLTDRGCHPTRPRSAPRASGRVDAPSVQRGCDSRVPQATRVHLEHLTHDPGLLFDHVDPVALAGAVSERAAPGGLALARVAAKPSPRLRAQLAQVVLREHGGHAEAERSPRRPIEHDAIAADELAVVVKKQLRDAIRVSQVARETVRVLDVDRSDTAGLDRPQQSLQPWPVPY